MTRASGQTSYYLGDSGGGGGGHPEAQRRQQQQQQQQPTTKQRLKQNRGLFCCCLFRLAKRLGADGWRAVFGDSKLETTTSAGSSGVAAASTAADRDAGIPMSPIPPGSVALLQQQVPPPPPLGPCGLVGLENQGATCYLNSLVQVIAASPELRRAIFAVSPEQLGLDEHGFPLNSGDQCLRRIPYELQRLLARVLLSESAYVSTRELTGSFGWEGRDLGDQHDVQELSRLLMHALEESLVDTGAYQAIKAAVAGAFVTGIECQSCGQVSSRTEEFLDICLATVGFASLEDSLRATYGGAERLEGPNQYRCDSCGKMVDAKKFCRLESLPPILTLSLMRFNYDLNRMQRVKNEAKFSFPEQLDMRPYMAATDSKRQRGGGGEFQFELYAVIAHCGSAMGGHYRAFVLDLERRGGGQQLMQQQIPLLQRCLVAATDTGGGVGASLPVQRVSSNSDLANSQGTSSATNSKQQQQHIRTASSGSGIGRSSKQQQQQQQQQQQRQWFVFSDTQVRQVQESALKEQFAGHECAYMLFYRRSAAASAPSTAATAIIDSANSEIPGWLCKSVLAENESIRQRREEFEIATNTIAFDVFLEDAFRLGEDLLIWERLQQAEGEQPPVGCVSIDCRLPVAELLRRVSSDVSSHMGSLLLLERTNCGYYCLVKLSELSNSAAPIRSTYQLASPHSTVALLCLSAQPHKLLLFGEENRPLSLTLRLFNQPPTERPYSRSTSLLSCLRSALVPDQAASESPEDASPGVAQKRFKAELERIAVYHRRSSIYTSYPLSKSDEIPRDRFKRSLHELGLRDGDALVVRLNANAAADAGDDPEGGRLVDSGFDGSAANGGSTTRGLSIVDVTFFPEDGSPGKTTTVEVNFDTTLGELKMTAVDQLCRESGSDIGKAGYSGYRLLVYNDQLASYCPEYESSPCQSLRYNTRPVRLEQAPAFADYEIFVRVRLLRDWQASPKSSSTLTPSVDLVVDAGLDTSELRRLAASRLVGPKDCDSHHLRFHSAGRALDEIKEGDSLSRSRVRHRACLCLVPEAPLRLGQLRIRFYERLPFGPDWQTLLTTQPERQFPHRCNLAVAEAGGCCLDLLLQALKDWLPENDPGRLQWMRLYSFRPAESRLVAPLQRWSGIRPLAEPGCGVAFERLPFSSPETPPFSQPGGLRMLLYLTVKPQEQHLEQHLEQQQQPTDYPPPEEFLWDCTSTSSDGDGAASLYRQVARHLGWQPAEVRLAKRLHHSCTWRPLPAKATSLRHGADLRDFDVLGCMRASAAGSSGLDRFESPADLRLLTERGGGVGCVGTGVGATPASGAAAPVVEFGVGSHERGLVINVPKYSNGGDGGSGGGGKHPVSRADHGICASGLSD